MDLNIFINTLGILIVTICCIVAAYTDVKYGVIPNKLTIPTIITGLLLVSMFYVLNGYINLFYYCSVVIVFLFNYILWNLGFWAGGDVKLFTAISTLLVPEFLNFFSGSNLSFISNVYGVYSIPTLYLMLNSISAIVPIIAVYCTYDILKNKRHLIKEIYNTINLKNSFYYLNITVIGYWIIGLLHVDNMLLKIVFSLVFLSIASQTIMNNKYLPPAISTIAVAYELSINNMEYYLIQWILFNALILFYNLFRNKIISQILNNEVNTSSLKEGMILKYPLCKKDDDYYFNNSLMEKYKILSGKSNETVLIKTNVSGLTRQDIQLLNKLNKKKIIDKVLVKKTMPFAPFILGGLIITLLFGNAPTYIMGMI